MVLVDREFSSKYYCYSYNYDKEHINSPPPQTWIEMELQ